MMGIIQEMSWDEVKEDLKQTRVALIPVGSNEQHGYHMPLGSDTFCADAVARRTASKENAVVVPAIPYGISHSHMSFPGTITLSCKTLFRVVTDVCECLYKHGINRFIFVNGHGHNSPTLQTVMDEFKRNHKAYFFLIQWWIAGYRLTPGLWTSKADELPDGHAAEVEAAGMLAINSTLVKMGKAEKVQLGTLGESKIKFHKSTMAALEGYPVDLITVEDFENLSKSGVVGSPLGASKEKGEIVLDKVTDFLADLVRELKKI
jgi:creatinine amidohydrolase